MARLEYQPLTLIACKPIPEISIEQHREILEPEYTTRTYLIKREN
jgi:hypothetical protein